MRFRGKIADIGCIQHFTRIIGTLSKLIKVCVLRITPSNWYFILSEKLVSGGVHIWCELPQGHFFDEYALEGVSEEANEIFLELAPENLTRALKTAQNAKWIKIKLTKKHSPCLTFEVDLPTLSSHSRTVVHDIPVTVIPRRHWEDYEEPEVPQFDVTIAMPQLKILKNVVDKMKNLSNYVILSANQNGEMKLMVETDMVSVSTHFRDLVNPVNKDRVPSSQSSDAPEPDPHQFAEARIDIRKFAQFLTGQQVNPTKVICNIAKKKVVHFFLLHDDVSLQYFMPVVSS
ncbi:checkpoint protein HUS1-like [Crassostrea angulata]|uniref:Checkpoint protein n=1 Tax=Magallana gigas TaxID=29159 RepID=A0A8W8NGD4_MAGGI|nr:checkpoint protein HUS1 [Crassostrea gigas]XP_052706478.1 checkpoint protein HUS1-like [Crassostrea angulata]|eukprot:XP_011419857.1 PREDICTED: checkpoint protein HUS1-like [Crassostrea gigas]